MLIHIYLDEESGSITSSQDLKLAVLYDYRVQNDRGL